MVFGLLFSSLWLFPKRFGRYILRPSLGVCRTREHTRNSNYVFYWIHGVDTELTVLSDREFLVNTIIERSMQKRKTDSHQGLLISFTLFYFRSARTRACVCVCCWNSLIFAWSVIFLLTYFIFVTLKSMKWYRLYFKRYTNFLSTKFCK